MLMFAIAVTTIHSHLNSPCVHVVFFKTVTDIKRHSKHQTKFKIPKCHVAFSCLSK